MVRCRLVRPRAGFLHGVSSLDVEQLTLKKKKYIYILVLFCFVLCGVVSLDLEQVFLHGVVKPGEAVFLRVVNSLDLEQGF